MGIGSKFKNTGVRIQQGAKGAAQSLGHMTLRLVSGFFIGLVLALIAQELFGFGAFMLTFLTLLFLSVIYKLLSSRTILYIVVFDVICVLIGFLLKMYILVGSQ